MLNTLQFSGYTGIEVIPVMAEPNSIKAMDLFQQVANLTPAELQLFHEKYMNYVSGTLDTDVVVLDESFKFLSNKEDDVYDEKYGYLLETKEGRNLHYEG